MTNKICRGIALLVTVLFIGIGGVHASDLPAGTSERVVASVRSLVQAGLVQAAMSDITRTMLENRFNDDQVLAVHRLFLNAAAQDLPTAPLTGKILEGISKRISPERIVLAVENVHARQLFALDQGKRVADSVSVAKDLADVYAASLSAGLTRADAEAITGQLERMTAGKGSTDGYALSMATMKTARDMARLGVHSDTLTGLLSGALNQGFDAGGMEAMHQSFLADARQADAETLATAYGNAIKSGTGFGVNASGGRTGRGEVSGHEGGADGTGGSGAGDGAGSGGSAGGSGSDGGQGSGGGSGSTGAGGNAGAGGGAGSGNGGGPGGAGSGH
ncbi:MAG: hypothetical protein LJE94_04855 [Deltaproteobacteria bacterium]|nr:hypothetical protein [Deltaproteobacteria bacterium]